MSDRKVVCRITGKKYIFGKDYYQKKVEEYKTEEGLKKYFVVRKAIQLINRGYSIEEIRKNLGVTNDDLTDVDQSDIQAVIEYHKVESINSKRFKSLAIQNLKSDPQVSEFIGKIKSALQLK